jgi:hypothetical protein
MNNRIARWSRHAWDIMPASTSTRLQPVDKLAWPHAIFPAIAPLLSAIRATHTQTHTHCCRGVAAAPHEPAHVPPRNTWRAVCARAHTRLRRRHHVPPRRGQCSKGLPPGRPRLARPRPQAPQPTRTRTHARAFGTALLWPDVRTSKCRRHTHHAARERARAQRACEGRNIGVDRQLT